MDDNEDMVLNAVVSAAMKADDVTAMNAWH